MEIRAANLLRAMSNGLRIQGDFQGRFAYKPFCPPILQASFDSGEAGNAYSHGPDVDSLPPDLFEDYANRAYERFLGEKSHDMPVLRVKTLLEAIGMACDQLAADPGSPGAPDPATRLNMQAGLQIVGVRICASPSVASLLQDSPHALRLSNARLPFSLRLIGCVVEAPLAMSNCKLVTLDLSGSALRGLDATFLEASGSVRLRRCLLVAPADFAGASIHGYFDAGDAIIKPLATPPEGQRLDGDRGMLNLNQARIDNDVQLGRATIWGGLSMRGLHTERSIHMDEAVILSPLGTLEALVWLGLTRANPQFVNESVYGGTQWTDDRKAFRDLVTGGSKAEPQKPAAYIKSLQRAQRLAAVMGGDVFFDLPPTYLRKTVLFQLLTHSLRARTSAIRGDGVEVGGSIFAQHLRANGRFRMKYAVVTGGLSLQGSRLRSAESMRRAFDELPVPLVAVKFWRKRRSRLVGRSLSFRRSRSAIKARMDWNDRLATLLSLIYLRLETYFAVVSEADFQNDVAPPYADAFVLDLRESRFGGSVRIGVPPDDSDKSGQAVQQTVIDGCIALQRATIDGELFLDGIQFQWSVRISDQHPDERATQIEINEYEAWLSNSAERKVKCTDVRDEQISKGLRHIVQARNVTVTDTVSLTGCQNLMGADFRNSTIRGDFLMLKRVQLQNVNGTAMIVAERPAIAPRGRINLEGVEIAGDCFLMFDGGMIDDAGEARSLADAVKTSGMGPSIEARLAQIGGELLIVGYPTERQLITAQKSLIVRTLTHTPRLIARTDELIKKDWQAAERASAQTKPEDSLEAWQSKRRAHPKIDLANARAALFTHMPNAWPRLDRLDIVGFRYDRAGTFGPLAPLPFVPHRQDIDGRPRNVSRVFSAVLAFLAAMAMAWISFGSGAGILGDDNLRWMTLITLLLAIQLAFPVMSSPFRRHSRPNGLSWLRLQRVMRNDSRTQSGKLAVIIGFFAQVSFFASDLRRWFIALLRRDPARPHRPAWTKGVARGKIYQSLEPYAIAAKALREEGRWISANLIEQRRLEVRTGQLSWRLHLFEKSGYLLVDFFARYGFNYVWPFFLSAYLVFGTAMIANVANERGYIQHKLVKVELHPAAGSNDATLAYSAKFGHRGRIHLNLDVGGPAPQVDAAACGEPPGICKEFNSLAFARDLVLPAVSTGADDEWEAKPGVWSKACPLAPISLRGLFDLLHLIGLAIFGFLLLGVTARIGLVINRYTE